MEIYGKKPHWKASGPNPIKEEEFKAYMEWLVNVVRLNFGIVPGEVDKIVRWTGELS